MAAIFGSRRRFVAASASALASIGAVTTAARAAQFEFKCGCEFPPDHPNAFRLGQMMAAVERESNGRVHISYFPNNSLGGAAAMFSQLRLGALHFQLIAPANLAAIAPVFDITSLGFAFRSEDEGVRAMQGPLSGHLQDELGAKGVRLFRGAWSTGMYVIGSTPREIRVPDDLHGFKIRVAESKIGVDLFRTLGANPTPIPFSDIYTGLQTHLIDGEAASAVSIESTKWYEFNKHVSVTNHAWAMSWLIANQQAWNSLPPDIQAIFERNNTRFTLLNVADTKVANVSVLTKMQNQGLTINRVDQTPFQKRLGSYYGTWSNTFGSTVMGLLQTALGRKFDTSV